MYYSPHTTGVIESRRMRWAEHGVRRQAGNQFLGRNLGQGPCGRSVNRKTNHEHVSLVNLVAQDRIQGRVFIVLETNQTS